MPLQICPRCKRFHYVPGECPVPKPATSPKSTDQVVSRLKGPKAEVTPELRGPKKSAHAGRTAVVEPKGALKAQLEGPEEGRTGTQARSADTPKSLIVGKQGGRPKTITDMKAYKAEKARIYRAQKAKK